MEVAGYILKALKEERVKHIFTVAAENIFPLLQASMKEGITLVNAKLELSAAFMSLIYARVTGLPGILLVTSGPGALGSLSPVAEAMLEGDPVLVLTTIPSQTGNKTHMHQLFHKNDQLDAFRSVTKQQFRVETIEQVPDVLSQAFCDMLSDRPGPVYVEVSTDKLQQSGQFKGYIPSQPHKPDPSINDVIAAVDALISAKFPVILAGRGVYESNAQSELIQLAELLNCPITTSIMAKGLVPADHPLFAGVAAGRSGDKVAETILQQADLVLALGNRFSELSTGRYSLEMHGRLVHVNVSSTDIGKAYEPDISITSDAKSFLAEVLNELRSRNVTRQPSKLGVSLQELWKAWAEELRVLHQSSSNAIEPWDALQALRELADRDAFMIGDVGAHRIETFLMPVYEPGTYVTTTSYVSMGLGVPGAVGASIAHPKRQVIGIVGDGGFLMTGFEVSTAAQYGASPVIVVFNDSEYRILRVYERASAKQDTEAFYKLPEVNFAMLGESIGVKTFTIKEKNELYSVMKKALSWKNGPVVIDVHVNPNAIPVPFQRLYHAKYISDLAE